MANGEHTEIIEAIHSVDKTLHGFIEKSEAEHKSLKDLVSMNYKNLTSRDEKMHEEMHELRDMSTKQGKKIDKMETEANTTRRNFRTTLWAGGVIFVIIEAATVVVFKFIL